MLKHSRLQSLIVFKPNKVVQEVLAWQARMGDAFGTATRCPFLVLSGPSLFGKTTFAKNLWGAERSLVLSCQGVKQPNMKKFRREQHKVVIFDEAHHSMVIGNKQLFQAGLDVVTLAQSNCMEHCYDIWMYGVPLIVSTNDWCLGAKADEVAWLSANSVVVDVAEPLFQDNQPIQQ